MTRYQHTQSGTTTLAILLITGVVVVTLFLATGVPSFASWITLGALSLVAWLFGSLTVEVDEHDLRWHFGPGLIWRCECLGDIESAEPGRSTWWHGWGIRLMRFGWLYNVSGYDYVKVTLGSGKQIAIGTDDPDGLLEALKKATA